MEAKQAKASITEIPADEIAEIIAAQEAPQVDVLDHGTIRETNTVYEDRTSNPVEDRDAEYEAVEETLESGTILTTFNAPVGGFPEAE